MYSIINNCDFELPFKYNNEIPKFIPFNLINQETLIKIINIEYFLQLYEENNKKIMIEYLYYKMQQFNTYRIIFFLKALDINYLNNLRNIDITKYTKHLRHMSNNFSTIQEIFLYFANKLLLQNEFNIEHFKFSLNNIINNYFLIEDNFS
jgi:hypothetical protein